MTAVHPSIPNCDIVHLADELDRVTGDVGTDGLHVDVMNNHFMPNLSWGLPVVGVVLAHSFLSVSAHLMIRDADCWAPAYAEIGRQIVISYVEVTTAPMHLVRGLHRLGAGAGIALRPATSLGAVADVLGEFDLLLLMTAEPGFGGQTFIESMLPKAHRARELIGARGFDLRVQVSGGTITQTIECATEAGVDVLVAGSAVYRINGALVAICRLRGVASSYHHDARG